MSEKPTETELQWAREIKKAAIADPLIDAEAVTDWEFLQHGIVAKEQTKKAVERLRNLQSFKEHYGIQHWNGSVEDAKRDLQTFVRTHPNFFLSLGESKQQATSSTTSTTSTTNPQVLCFAYRNFNAQVMKHSKEALAIYLRAAYYVLNASQYKLSALRSGLAVIVDCQGMNPNRNYSRQAEIQARELFIHGYPIRIHTSAMLQTFTLMRILYQLIKPFLSRKLVQVLCAPSNGVEYLAQWPKEALPSAWGGTCPDFLETIVQRLQKRQQIMDTFRL